MVNVFMVGIGGFIGAVLRYLTSEAVKRWFMSGFPLATLAVNILGSFILGYLVGLADRREVFSAEASTFLLVGMLGAFTTFSTFSLETTTLLRDGSTAAALLNVGAQVLLGVAAVWLGLTLALTR